MVNKEEEKRKKYAKMSALQLLMLRKRLKFMKAMPELVAMKNDHILNQDNYNKRIAYDKLRNVISEKIPPNQMSRETKRKVVNLLTPQSSRSSISSMSF